MRNTGIFSSHSLALFGFTLLLSALEPALAETQTLLPPQQGDVISERLNTITLPPPAANARREEVRFSWPLTADHDLAATQTTYQAESKLYWFKAAGSELTKGIPIEVSAAKAVVRISPLSSAGESNVRGPALDPALIEMRHGAQSLRGKAAMEVMAGQEELAASGSPFPPGTTAFRMAKSLGAGAFELSTGQPVPADARYLVEVIDQHSDAIMALRTDSSSYMQGQTLSASINLQTGLRAGTIDTVNAVVVSPSGKRYPADTKPATGGAYEAVVVLGQEQEPVMGLWELHAQLRGKAAGGPVRRNAKTAFSFATPYAQILKQVDISHNAGDNLTAAVMTEVTAPSRYAVRGILYGSDAAGVLKPVAVAETARWIEAGREQITLVFNSEHLKSSGLIAPYELRDLQLVDQGRMTLQYRQQRALHIN